MALIRNVSVCIVSSPSFMARSCHLSLSPNIKALFARHQQPALASCSQRRRTSSIGVQVCALRSDPEAQVDPPQPVASSSSGKELGLPSPVATSAALSLLAACACLSIQLNCSWPAAASVNGLPATPQAVPQLAAADSRGQLAADSRGQLAAAPIGQLAAEPPASPLMPGWSKLVALTQTSAPALTDSGFIKAPAPLPTVFPDLPDLKLPDFTRVVLPNGLKVFLLEDHEVPLVSGELIVRGGSQLEPVDKLGLARMMSYVQRSGGSEAHPGEELDLLLERLAARIEASPGVEDMSLSFSCLAEDTGDILKLFGEVALNPRMPEDRLEIGRAQLLGGIARRNDAPEGIAGRELRQLIYGKDSLYARTPEVETVNSITREDLFNLHEASFRPEQGFLGVVGDFDSETMLRTIERVFGSWKGGKEGILSVAMLPEPQVEEGISKTGPAIYLAAKEDLSQGYVRTGELGIQLKDEDLATLDLVDEILNGFGGRLFDQVRTREGLAYSVSAGWSPGLRHRGLFVAGGETSITTLPQFVGSVRRVLQEFSADGPTPEELVKAKESVTNSFVFLFSSSGRQLGRILSYEMGGISQDFPFLYLKSIAAVTESDIVGALQRHLHLDQQPIVVVADGPLAEEGLKKLGLPIVPVQLR